MTSISQKGKGAMLRPIVLLSVMSLFCLATLSGCSLLLTERSLDARYLELPFDEAHWKEVRCTAENNRRANMVGDLVENHLRRGMTKDEVENLLGHRDDRTSGGNGWVYRFTPEGFEDLFGRHDSGSHYLVIRFDEDDKYIGYSIIIM